MKVIIPEQVVEVDAEAWAEAYGVEADEVASDVQDYFSNHAQAVIDNLGLGKKQ